MHTTLPNGIRIEYESLGLTTAPPIVLIMGLGAPLTRWNREICDGLVARGYRVVRFDNRDCGRSTHLDGTQVPNIGAALRHGTPMELPYTLDDMALDTVLLLDALEIEAAHVVGMSMGGAIAQIVAAKYPERALSLTCIMSSSGNPGLPGPTEAAEVALFAPLPQDRSRDSIVADGVFRYRIVSSPAYPPDEQRLVSMLAQEYDRGLCPQGVARQLAAILASGDRRELLHTIAVPALVIHGASDPLIPLECGQDVFQHLPHARMLAIEGMGHDLPVALTDDLVDTIVSVCAASRTAGLE